MKYIEAKCTDPDCTQPLPSMVIGLYQMREASESIEQMVAQSADTHAQASGHDVVMHTVFRRV